MKIFELRWHDGEREWIAANTNIEALQAYNSVTDVDIQDFEHGAEIVELPESEWKNYNIRMSDDPDDVVTLAERIKGVTSAELMAGTVYD